MPNLMNEIALRAGDSNFDDLQKNYYKKALLIAKRKVAKRYNLIQRLYTTEINIVGEEEITSPNETEDVKLPMPNFVSEYQVLINDEPYTKADRLTIESEKEYVLERNHNQILFNYWVRSEKDVVKIYFTSDINKEDFELETEAPIIPSQYNEEVMSLALVEIAKFGIIKYSGSDKEARYVNLVKLYGMDEVSLDKELIKNDKWAQIEVYHVY